MFLRISLRKIWHLADTKGAVRRDVVALYNWGKKPVSITCPVGRIGLPAAKEYVGFDFWSNKFIAPFKDSVTAELVEGSCRILAIRPVSENPQLLSTSRHITQGIVDVADEKWDAGKGTLSAVSKVVAEDSYELRIVVPAGEKSWRITGISVSSKDKAAGVKTEFKQDGKNIRVTITSPVSREVKWTVQFEKLS